MTLQDTHTLNSKHSALAVLLGFVVIALGITFFVHISESSHMAHAHAGETYYTSQTIPLLEAARSVDPLPAIGGGGIAMVDNMALVAPTSPEGVAEVIE